MSTLNNVATLDEKPLIMVVDDNVEFLSGIALTLEMENFNVWTANDGKEALDELHDVFRSEVEVKEDTLSARLPDLILADIMMPIMDGYDFYDKVRKNPYLNHIPFIFLTAKGEADDIRLGKELGIDDYLPKLTPTEDIMATIRGKLKRVEQRRAIAEQFNWNSKSPLEGRSIILLVVIVVLILVAFVIGFVVAIAFFG